MQRFLLVAAATLFMMFPSFGATAQSSGSSMKLVLLGTGYPYPDPERAGPSCAIIVGQKIFIVDAGRGVGLRLARFGNPWRYIEAVFLTHLHSDHYDGLPDLFHNTWQFGSGKPFELYGPKGTQELSDGILKFYGPDIHIRRDLTEKLSAEGAKIYTHIIQEGVVYEIPGEVRVTAFNVDHAPVTPAFGYRFDAGEHSIVVSGDTRPSPNLIRFAQDVDILVHEAYAGATAPSDSAAKRPWSIHDYHTSAEEAGEIAQKANAKILVLTHLIPGNAPEKEFMDPAKKKFSGKILVGRDLMIVEPPVESNQK